MRNVFGVLFFIAAGFLVYMLGLFAFISMPEVGNVKWILLSLCCIPLVIFHLLGLALFRKANWQTSTGITLLSGVGMTLMVVVSVASMRSSPEVMMMENAYALELMSDYVAGSVVSTLLACLGGLLLFIGNTTKKKRQQQPSSNV
ncbi:hypothetical protein [Shewanella sp.]|uniref:hypothetical protein n=1 Tax=Shewanella sp. TaxID=50422 RepID=UPI003A968D4A